MKTDSTVSPILPSILASLLDPEHDIVRIVSPNYSGLGQAFASYGFKGCHESAPGEAPALQSAVAADCTVVVNILPFRAGRDNLGITQLRKFLEGPAQKIVLVVMPAILFSNRKDERSLRRDLLTENRLEASIALPGNLLPDTRLPVSILILDKRRTFKDDPNVRFIDASQLDIAKVSTLWQDEKLSELRNFVIHEMDYKQLGCVTKDARDLCVSDESLLATAHCLNEEERQTYDRLQRCKTIKLGKLVNFFRPLLPSKTGKGEQLRILNPGQLEPWGYTTPSGQSTAQIERAGKTDQLLQPGDVVLGIRGMLGKVGIISPEWTDTSFWVVSQSCIILRPALKNYDMRLLFIYLRSEMGQIALNALACGATVPLVQINDLKNMDIPFSSEEDAQIMLHDFATEVSLCRDIDNLKKQRDNLISRHWSLTM